MPPKSFGFLPLGGRAGAAVARDAGAGPRRAVPKVPIEGGAISSDRGVIAPTGGAGGRGVAISLGLPVAALAPEAMEGGGAADFPSGSERRLPDPSTGGDAEAAAAIAWPPSVASGSGAGCVQGWPGNTLVRKSRVRLPKVPCVGRVPRPAVVVRART
jgi:hypothetical protein